MLFTWNSAQDDACSRAKDVERAVPVTSTFCDLHMQTVNVEAEGLKKQIEKLEGNIGSLHEQLEAARKESKTLKADSKTFAGLEGSIKKEQARAQVLIAATST